MIIHEEDAPAINAALSAEVQAEYSYLRELPDGRIIGVRRLMFHWTMSVDLDETGLQEAYCYDTEIRALIGLLQWDGNGDPEGWHRHPTSGRRRNIETGEEVIAW